MRKLFLILSLASLSLHVGAADNTQTCNQKAHTQLDINSCAGSELSAADKELNLVYQAILKKHKDNKKFLSSLKTAQQAWLLWRDAELKAIYPEGNDAKEYGSTITACWPQQVAALTRDRTKQLRKWIDGVEEGDVCAGSVPFKE